MAGFQVNYDAAASGSYQIEPGEYEVILTAPKLKETKWGTVQLDLPMVIRNDIQQPHPNVYIWHNLSKKKNPTPEDESAGGYSIALIQQLSKAAQLPNGKAYPSIQAWFDDMAGRPLRVTLQKETYIKRDNTQGERVRVSDIQPTNYPQINHVMKAPKQQTAPGQAQVSYTQAARSAPPATAYAPASYPPGYQPPAPLPAYNPSYAAQQPSQQSRYAQPSFTNTGAPGMTSVANAPATLPPDGFTLANNEDTPF